MDKLTFYAELSERLAKLEVSRDYIERHLKQFDVYFAGKTDDEVASEIAKLGDLDRVATRIKRMTDKMINTEAKAQEESRSEHEIENRATADAPQASESMSPSSNVDATPENASDDDVIVVKNKVTKKRAQKNETDPNHEEIQAIPMPEAHGTRRGSDLPLVNEEEELVSVTVDEETLRRNRRKFWVIFAVTLPITLAVLAATALAFAFTFFLIAVLIILSVGGLVAITAIGTLVSVLGMIFGVAQMLSSLPIGLYECGIAIVAGSLAMFVGILVYNFAVRLMPFAAKWLLVLGKFVIRKYKELFVYLKKECIGL